jgi:hypothetical protein
VNKNSVAKRLTNNLDRSLQLEQHGLADEDLARLQAQILDLGLCEVDMLAGTLASNLKTETEREGVRDPRTVARRSKRLKLDHTTGNHGPAGGRGGRKRGNTATFDSNQKGLGASYREEALNNAVYVDVDFLLGRGGRGGRGRLSALGRRAHLAVEGSTNGLVETHGTTGFVRAGEFARKTPRHGFFDPAPHAASRGLTASG